MNLIRADIERTRADLGDTVEALSARANAKARQMKRRIWRPIVMTFATVAVTAAVLALVRRKRTNGHSRTSMLRRYLESRA